jgi:hypothetical protein
MAQVEGSGIALTVVSPEISKCLICENPSVDVMVSEVKEVSPVATAVNSSRPVFTSSLEYVPPLDPRTLTWVALRVSI